MSASVEGTEEASTDAEEVEDGTPVFRDYPVYGALIKDAGSNKESAICHMIVHNDVKIHGGEIEEKVLRQILTARANYPSFFGVIAEWDRRFPAIGVALVLRGLGYI